MALRKYQFETTGSNNSNKEIYNGFDEVILKSRQRLWMNERQGSLVVSFGLCIASRKYKYNTIIIVLLLQY
jgi:hypothetical protein